MNPPSRLIIILLSVAALGCAFFAYREHHRQIASQTTLDSLEKERSALQLRVTQLEKPMPRPPGPLALGSAPETSPKPIVAAPGTISSRQIAELRSEAGFGNSASGNLLENPDMQKLMGLQQRAALDNRFAALFRQLKLSPSDLEKLKNFLVEKQTALMEVRTAAQSQGFNGRDGREVIRERLTDAQTQVDNKIRSALGDAVFTKYQNYEQTLAERLAITQLEQRLSYSSSPLTGDQAEKLIGILAETSPTREATPGSQNYNPAVAALRAMGNNMGVAAPLTPALLTRSEGLLNTEQLAALRQLYQEQEAKAQLAQQLRTTISRPLPTSGSSVSADHPADHP